MMTAADLARVLAETRNMSVSESIRRGNAIAAVNSVAYVMGDPDLTELLIERLENDGHSLRDLAVAAMRVACKPLIDDSDYREVGRIAEKMVKDAAVQICNEQRGDDEQA